MQLISVGKSADKVAITAGWKVMPLIKAITKLCPVVVTNLVAIALKTINTNFVVVGFKR